MKKIAGFSAIGEAFIYIIAFVIYGGVLQFPTENNEQVIVFLKENYVLLYIMNMLIYVLFGVFLAVLVLGIHQHIRDISPNLSQVATVFGSIWVGLVIAAGMIGNIALTTVINMTDTQQALETWNNAQIVTEGLGGGNEVVGGLWVLLLTIAVLKQKEFPKFLVVLGMLVGLAGIFTIYPMEIFTEIFGLSQIVWFIGIGIFLIRNK